MKLIYVNDPSSPQYWNHIEYIHSQLGAKSPFEGSKESVKSFRGQMDIMEKECDTSLQRLNNDQKPVFSIGSNVD